MPNHIHAILVLGATDDQEAAKSASFGGAEHTPTLGDLVRKLKAASTRLIRMEGLPEFAWQPNYFERVIRSDRVLHQVRLYIEANPSRWETDDLFRA